MDRYEGLDFKEKLLKYIKQTKPDTTRHAQLLTVAVLAALTAAFLFSLTKPDQDMTSEELPTLDVLQQQNDDQVSLAFGGDLMLARFTEDSFRTRPTQLLGDAEPLFDQADWSMANLETPVIDSDVKLEAAEDRETIFRADPDMLGQLSALDMVGVANNHAADYGRASVTHTLEHLHSHDIASIGGGQNSAEAYEVHYEDFDGFTVGFVALNDISTPDLAATRNAPGVASMNLEDSLPVVRQAADNSDLTVVNVHWGVEYKTHSTRRQQNLAASLAAVGADVIVGHHPHVLQPVDVIDNTLVFYSLGNLVADQGWSDTKESAVPVLVVDKETKAAELYIEPFRISNARPENLAGGLGLYRNKLQYKLQRGSGIDFEKHDSALVAEVSLGDE